MTDQTAVRSTGVLSILQGIIVERQRLLIREANYLRGLVGLPPVRAGKERSEEETRRDAAGTGNGSGIGATRE